MTFGTIVQQFDRQPEAPHLVAFASDLQLRGQVPTNVTVRDFPTEGATCLFRDRVSDPSDRGEEVAGWKYTAEGGKYGMLIIND